LQLGINIERLPVTYSGKELNLAREVEVQITDYSDSVLLMQKTIRHIYSPMTPVIR